MARNICASDQDLARPCERDGGCSAPQDDLLVSGYLDTSLIPVRADAIVTLVGNHEPD
jgi:hypothetical protein